MRSPLALALPGVRRTAYAAGDRFCGECGAALARSAARRPAAAARPVAERRLVSVLFADLVGFTTLSERRDPEEVRELLSRYFDTCSRLIGLYGGTVEKFIGDAVMAVWGTPTATEDDAERAVRAALDLVAAVSALGDEVGAPELRARAGVLTGEAAVTIGAEGQGMVAGDLVNTAVAHPVAPPSPGTVLVGDTTRRATEQTVVYEDAGTHALKGKDEPAPLWRALRVVSGARGALKSTGLEAPFVGRDRELRRDQGSLPRVRGGAARRTSSRSPASPGSASRGSRGSSTSTSTGSRRSTYWHRGRCLSYGEGVTYWALADMVRMRCRIGEEEEPAVAREKLARALEEHMPDAGRARVRRAAAGAAARPRRARGPRQAGPVRRVAALLRAPGGRLPDRARVRGHAVGRREPARLRRVPARVVAQLADLRRHAGAAGAGRPATDVGRGSPQLHVAVPRAAAARGDGASCSRVSFPACPNRRASRSSRAPRACRCTRSRRCGCCSTAACSCRRARVYPPVGEIGELEVPETLHALIAARLDGLSAEERRVLAGRGGARQDVHAGRAAPRSRGLDADALEPLLARSSARRCSAVQADPRSPEHGQYGFLQDLVRHVAYETLSRHERRARHLAAAEFLRTAFPDEDEIAEVVAAHYVDAFEANPDAPDAAEVRRLAHEALVRAGDRAESLAAAEEALRYLVQAAELTEDVRERARLLGRAGWLAYGAADFETAVRLLTESIELYGRLADARCRTGLEPARLRRALAGTLRRGGRDDGGGIRRAQGRRS